MATKRDFLGGYKTYDDSKGRGHPDEWKDSFYKRMTEGEAKRVIKDTSTTPWEVLGIAKNATGKEIKQAFRRLIIEWHPDRNPYRMEEATRRTKQIIAAYTIMTKD